MPDIQAFRGLRYDLQHVGSLAACVAPPYDVIDAALQDRLYQQHPANVIRLILNREEPGDDERSNRYARAANFLAQWRAQGVLVPEPAPAVYVYHQEFEHAGRRVTRRGFMSRVRLERFGEGRIYPHEETMSGPKQDRLLLTRACRANLSQVFGLYPDAASSAQGTLEQAMAGISPVEAVDHLGVVHRMWPVTDPHAIGDLARQMADKPIFIADGHHRYETACNYRDELTQAAGGALPPDHPARFVLMMCVGMSDPGMVVLPTHRLFRGLPAMTSDELARRLGDSFACRVAGEGSDLAAAIWAEIERNGDQGTLGLYTAADDRWLVARVTPAGRARMAQVAADHSPDWQSLGVAILHRLLVETLLAARDLPKPEYVHLVSEVVAGLEREDFPLAALVMPATLDHIQAISRAAERMPAKSTYFYPKLLSGLVFHSLEPQA